MQTLENLRRIRAGDPATFDQLLGGLTQQPGLYQAYITHEIGRRYERGLKRFEELTALEKYSMGLPLTPQERAHLANRQRRPVEG